MTDHDREFDLILWGATGFTGQLVAEYLVGRSTPADLHWAIAGRNREKLERLRETLGRINGYGQDLPIRIANARRPRSLRKLAEQTAVLCSTVGPYSAYGTPAVEACVDRKTDYCDLTGEVPWIRRMIEQFHGRAVEDGTRIVHACGFDAVPSDIGTLIIQTKAQEEFGTACEEVRGYVESRGAQVSGGTAASMVRMFEDVSGNAKLQRLLNDTYSLVPGRTETELPTSGRWSPGYDQWIKRWTVPFVMELINRSVVHRSNILLNADRERFFHYREFVPVGGGMGGAIGALAASAGLTVLEQMLMMAPLRNLLTKWILPSPGQGPDRSAIENGSFRVTLMGRGKQPGNDRPFLVKGTIQSDRDPGYGSTARMLGEAALCLVLDDVDSPLDGGVLTPASGIGLPLVERLERAGISCTAAVMARP